MQIQVDHHVISSLQLRGSLRFVCYGHWQAVRLEPYNLPPSFEWSDVNLNDADQVLSKDSSTSQCLTGLHSSCACGRDGRSG